MCGIIGYIGCREAYPILISGLRRLEYRGYDSAGIALVDDTGRLNICKSNGRIGDLELYAQDKPKNGSIGIAHTRWATHGEPNQVNAHPHCSSSGKIALVHNGIIENYATLKTMLQQNGYEFKSNTDTEVLVQLIEFISERENIDLLSAVQIALSHIIGAYAIAILEKNNPDCVIAARKSSPMVIGIGDGEYFIASDATPIVEYTSSVVYLGNEEIAVINRSEGLKIFTIDNKQMSPKVIELDLTLSQLEKGGYDHFMLKEIFEQPKTIIDCTRGRINNKDNIVTLSGVNEHSDRFLKARRIIIVACGTSWHAGLIGEHLIESLSRIPVEVEYASEFRYRNPVVNEEDIVIAISQSGETADTLAAIELAKQKGAFIYGICNSVGSSIARKTDAGSYIHVGPEIGVASTKAFTGQVTVLTMLALILGKANGTIEESLYSEILSELSGIPDKIKAILSLDQNIKQLSLPFTYAENFIYLGRGINYPVALEGALKLKEISYVHAEGYPAAEMKHGPIALVDAGMPVVVISTRNSVYDKIIGNIQEIKARKGTVIAIVTKGEKEISKIADYILEIPDTLEYLEPLLTSIPLQLLAYHMAVNKGRNVDQPRNLAKSVTVE